MSEQRFHIGDLVIVILSRQRGTVTGRAGDWSKADERNCYMVKVWGRRGGESVFHADEIKMWEDWEDELRP